MWTSEHPLAVALRRAASGSFPAADGVVEVTPPDDAGTHAVVEFSGHSFVLTDRAADDELLAGVDAFGGATEPRLLAALAGAGGWIGSLDLVMVRRAGRADATPLPATDAYRDHPRVVRAGEHRRDVVVLGDGRGVVCVGTGLVGRTELSVELIAAPHSTGVGRELVTAALATRPDDEWVFAQVAAGNAASVRMFLACGFVPIGSEVLFSLSR